MAYRLIDHANGITDARRRAVVQLYAESTDLLRVLPFMPEPNGFYAFDRTVALPTAGFRSLNEGFTESTGRTERVIEHTYELGGDVDIDIANTRDGNADKRAMQEQMKIVAIAQTFDYNFIKGDHNANRESFSGLQARAGTTGPNVIDVNGELSLAVLDEAIENTKDPTHLYMTRSMRRRLTAAARTTSVGGQIDYVVDDFGRQVPAYAGLPILLSDPVGHAQPPLAFNETNASSPDEATTSIYVMSIGTQGIFGIQASAPDVRDLGELDAKPSLRTRVDWSCGLVVSRPESFTRLRRITNEAFVA